jgi:hypothetical protein
MPAACDRMNVRHGVTSLGRPPDGF